MNIMKTLIKEDINHRGFELEFHLDGEMPGIPLKVIGTYEDTEFLYVEKDGLVRFGARSLVPSMGHDAGYIWSSRASVFNAAFGKRCMECTVVDGGGHRFASACTVELALKAILANGGDYYVLVQEEYESGLCTERSYIICDEEAEKRGAWYFADNDWRKVVSRIRPEVLTNHLLVDTTNPRQKNLLGERYQLRLSKKTLHLRLVRSDGVVALETSAVMSLNRVGNCTVIQTSNSKYIFEKVEE